MNYTIEKKRPPKKENDEKKEKRKDFDYLYAIFGEYEKILNNIDIFDRGYELKKINIDKTFPKYIVENQNILHDWIL